MAAQPLPTDRSSISVAHLDQVFVAIAGRDPEILIGPREHLHISALLLRLTTEHQVPRTFSELGRWIAPVLATSVAQQRAVQEACSALDTKQARGSSGDGPAKVRDGGKNSQKWRNSIVSIGLAMLVVGGIAGSLFLGQNTAQLPNEPGITTQTSTDVRQINLPFGPIINRALGVVWSWLDGMLTLGSLSALALTLSPLLLAMWFASKRPEGLPTFTRDRPSKSDLIRQLPLAEQASYLFNSPTMRERFSRLRLWRRDLTPYVDPVRTIDRLARNHGAITGLDYRERASELGLVVLIDRQVMGDHLAVVADMVVTRLRAASVNVAAYDFLADPTKLLDQGKQLGPETIVHQLEALSGLHAGENIIIVADALRLKNRLRRGLPRWLITLQRKHNVSVIVPSLPHNWGSAEGQLISDGIPVFPATEQGLCDYARFTVAAQLGDDRSRTSWDKPRLYGSQSIAVPEDLVFGPAPPFDEIREIVGEIRAAVSPAAFKLLCTLSVFPVIEPKLTLHLGRNVQDYLGNPLLTDKSLAELNRFAWLRLAYLPEWLRKALAPELDKAQLEAIHSTIVDYFERSSSGDFEVGAVTLAVHLDKNDSQKWVSDILSDGDQQHRSVMQDALFLRFMETKEITDLDTPAGEAMADEIKANVSRRFWATLGAGATATIVMAFVAGRIVDGLTATLIAGGRVIAEIVPPELYLAAYSIAFLVLLATWFGLQVARQRLPNIVTEHSARLATISLRVGAALLAAIQILITLYDADGAYELTPLTGNTGSLKVISSLFLLWMTFMKPSNEIVDIVSLSKRTSPFNAIAAFALLATPVLWPIRLLEEIQSNLVFLMMALPVIVSAILFSRFGALESVDGNQRTERSNKYTGSSIIFTIRKNIIYIINKMNYMPIFLFLPFIIYIIIEISIIIFDLLDDFKTAIFCITMISAIFLSIIFLEKKCRGNFYYIIVANISINSIIIAFSGSLYEFVFLDDVYIAIISVIFLIINIIGAIFLLFYHAFIFLNIRIAIAASIYFSSNIFIVAVVGTIAYFDSNSWSLFNESILLSLTTIVALVFVPSILWLYIRRRALMADGDESWDIGKTRALLYVPVLWFLCGRIEIVHLAEIPLNDFVAFAAAWLAWRYGWWGAVAAIVGALPLALQIFPRSIYGIEGSIGEFAFVVALVFVVGQRGRLAQLLSADTISLRHIAYVALGLNVSFILFVGLNLSIEFTASFYFAWVLFVIGLSRAPLRLIAWACFVMGLLGLFLEVLSYSTGLTMLTESGFFALQGLHLNQISDLWMPVGVLALGRIVRTRLLQDVPKDRILGGTIRDPLVVQGLLRFLGSDWGLLMLIALYLVQSILLKSEVVVFEFSDRSFGLIFVDYYICVCAAFSLGLLYGQRVMRPLLAIVIIFGFLPSIGAAWFTFSTGDSLIGIVYSINTIHLSFGSTFTASTSSLQFIVWGWMGVIVGRETFGLRRPVALAAQQVRKRLWGRHLDSPVSADSGERESAWWRPKHSEVVRESGSQSGA